MGPHRTRIRITARRALAAAAVTLALAGPSTAAAPLVSAGPPGASPLSGIQDAYILADPNPAARVARAANAGAAIIRVELRWDQVATTRPVDPTNPADPAYQWGRYDAIAAAAAAAKVQVLFTVYGTPAWARDTGVALDPRWENWSIRPADPADYGRFGEAAARRYAPLGVRKWEGWNEPNIALFLRPQYVRSGGSWTAASPATYAALQSAFYAGVKRADPGATVAGGVTAPAGDRCPACPLDQAPVRVTPDDFIAALGKPGLRPPMDVVSHHPYPLSGPRNTTPPKRTYVDLYNIRTLVAAIDATYLKGKRLWLTEYGFATRRVPEYPTFFTPAKQAAYIADAYRRMKANPRIAMGVYYLLQDHPGWASGVLDTAGRAKPGYQSLALPFAATTPGAVRRGARAVLVGQARASRGATTVLIQRRSGSRWVTVKRVRTSGDGSFTITVRPAATTVLRARWSGRTRTGAVVANTSVAVTIPVR